MRSLESATASFAFHFSFTPISYSPFARTIPESKFRSDKDFISRKGFSLNGNRVGRLATKEGVPRVHLTLAWKLLDLPSFLWLVKKRCVSPSDCFPFSASLSLRSTHFYLSKPFVIARRSLVQRKDNGPSNSKDKMQDHTNVRIITRRIKFFPSTVYPLNTRRERASTSMRYPL